MLSDPLLYHLHHVCENENEIKFHYVQNSACLVTIIYDNRPIYNSRASLCNGGTIHVPVSTALLSGKAHVVPVVPITTPMLHNIEVLYVCS